MHVFMFYNCMYVCIYLRMCVCVYVCMHAFMFYICMYVRMHACMYVRTYICMYVGMYGVVTATFLYSVILSDCRPVIKTDPIPF